jgi:hypothetical protein
MDNCKNSTLKSDTLENAHRAKALKKIEPPETLAKNIYFTAVF